MQLDFGNEPAISGTRKLVILTFFQLIQTNGPTEDESYGPTIENGGLRNRQKFDPCMKIHLCHTALFANCSDDEGSIACKVCLHNPREVVSYQIN